MGRAPEVGWHLEDDDAKRVGRWVAHAREARGLSQKLMIDKTGGSVSRLSDIENGKQGPRGWNFQTIRNLERGLDVPHGTLQRVADGEDVKLEDLDASADADLAQVQRTLERVIEELEERDRRHIKRLSELEQRLRSLEQ